MENKKLKVGNVPPLRFPGFEGEWEVKKLGEIAEIARGKSKHRPRDADFLFGGKYPFIQTGDIKKADLYLTEYNQTYSEQGLKQSKLWNEDTLCITIAANIAETAILKIKACFPDSIIGLIPHKDKTTVLFVKYSFDKFKILIQRLSQGVAQDNLNQEKLSKIEFNFPSLSEQQKIASFLSLIDQRIATQNKIIEELKLLKNTLSKKIFSGQLKFKDEFGNNFPKCKVKKLGEVLIKNSTKNKTLNYSTVQSVSNKYGFINQEDFFEDRRVASIDTSNYYVIDKGCFAYNPSRIDVGSLAYKTDNNISVISPLYVSFRADNNHLIDNYLLNWFFCTEFIHQMHNSFEGSVRNTLSYESLERINISIPNIAEQIKVSDYLSSISSKIEIETHILQKLEEQKQYLLQNMFV